MRKYWILGLVGAFIVLAAVIIAPSLGAVPSRGDFPGIYNSSTLLLRDGYGSALATDVNGRVLLSPDSTFTSLSLTNLTSTNIYSLGYTGKGSFTSITSTNAYLPNLTFTNLSLTGITSTNAYFTNLSLTNASLTSITSTNAYFTNLALSSASLTSLTSTNIYSLGYTGDGSFGSITSTNSYSSNFQGNANLLSITSTNIYSLGYTGKANLTSVTSTNIFFSNLAGVAYTFPTSQGAASTVLTNDGAGALSWAASSGGSGDTTLGTQTNWTATFTAYYVDATSVTTTLASQAIASTTAQELENKLISWTNSTSVLSKYAWIKGVSQSGAVLTLTANGNAFDSDMTNFRVSRNHEVQKFHWYIPGQCVADATNPVGVMYSIPTTSIYFLSLDGLLGQPNTSTLTVNLYASTTADGLSTALFATAPDFGANGSVINNAQFTTSTVAGQAMIRLRTPACGSGGAGSDMDLWAYYMKSGWQGI
jgi:hypothetical protein